MYGLPIKKIEFQNQHGNDVVLSLDAQVRADISPKDFVFLKFISCDAFHWIRKAIEQRKEMSNFHIIQLNWTSLKKNRYTDMWRAYVPVSNLSSTIINLPIKNKN